MSRVFLRVRALTDQENREVRRVGLSGRVVIDNVDPDAATPIAILKLEYADGEHENKPMTLARVEDQVTASIDTGVRCDFDRMVLVRAEISVTIAAQLKPASIRDVELIRDPNPAHWWKRSR